MTIALIAAMAKNRVIGYQNQLPWQVSADLRHFKALTVGKPIIMGRKTYESIGKPLPERHNIVITKQPGLALAGCDVVNSLQEAVLLARPEIQEVMIIGGAQIFAEALPLADKLYLTLLDLDVTGDVFFPVWENLNWHEKEQIDFIDDKSKIQGKFITLERD